MQALRQVLGDDLLSYYTYKRVQVRDARLGLLFYCSVFVAVFYVVFETIWIRHGYLEYEPIVASIRLDLVGGTQRLGSTSSYPYCATSPTRALNDSVAAELSIAEKQFSTADMHIFPEWHREITLIRAARKADSGIGCVYRDGHGLVFPPHEDGAMLVTTSMFEQRQERRCALNATECNVELWQTNSARVSYSLGVEDLDLLVEQGIAHRATNPAGDIVDSTGAVRRHIPPGESLTLRISELLDLAGVELDELAPDMPNELNLTRRDAGLILAIEVSYSNFEAGSHFFPQRDPTWTLSVRTLSGDFSVDEVREETDTSRLHVHRTGVRIKAFQSGSKARFSLSVLLIHIASGMVIIGTAQTVVDLLSTNVLGDHERYRSYIFEKTETEEQAQQRKRQQSERKRSVVTSMRSATLRKARLDLEAGRAGYMGLGALGSLVPGAVTPEQSKKDEAALRELAAEVIQQRWRARVAGIAARHETHGKPKRRFWRGRRGRANGQQPGAASPPRAGGAQRGGAAASRQHRSAATSQRSELL